jgi:hypothetical protein
VSRNHTTLALLKSASSNAITHFGRIAHRLCYADLRFDFRMSALVVELFFYGGLDLLSPELFVVCSTIIDEINGCQRL